MWSSDLYRLEVWEREYTNWAISRKVPKNKSPQPGDIMVLFYAPSGESDPGIYGWAVVIRFDGYEIRFMPSSPSDYMKMNPVWSDDVKNIVDQIRGPVATGTMWKIEESLFKQLRQKIAEHVYGVSP
jgi:hypothetical protein